MGHPAGQSMEDWKRWQEEKYKYEQGLTSSQKEHFKKETNTVDAEYTVVDDEPKQITFDSAKAEE